MGDTICKTMLRPPNFLPKNESALYHSSNPDWAQFNYLKNLMEQNLLELIRLNLHKL